MKKKILIVNVLFFTFLFVLNLNAQDKSGMIQGKIRIKLTDKLANKIEATPITKNAKGYVVTGVEQLDALNSKNKVVKMKRLYPYAGKFEWRHRKFGLHLWYEIDFQPVKSPDKVVEMYKEISGIQIAEAVYKKIPLGVDVKNDNGRKEFTEKVNDPYFNKQWHYFNDGTANFSKAGCDIWLQNAWLEETGDKDVIVAIIDWGLDLNHEDLKDNLWTNAGEVPDNGIDDDNNGVIDDIHGFNAVDNTGSYIPGDHGTHVAGVIAASNNNEIGIAGIAGGTGSGDGVRLMACAIFNNNEQSPNFGAAFVYAADNGAVISQNSWGYQKPDVIEQAILDGIDYFVENAGYDANHQPTGPMQGGVVFFAAGNSNATGNWWPACYENVIAVASTGADDKRSSFSNYGLWVDIAAPGGSPGVFSTVVNNGYEAMQGTSMACPHVSGVAALIVSKFKHNITPQEVIDRLLNSADPIDDINPGFESKIGKGRLNAYYALVDTVNDNLTPNTIADLSVIDETETSIILSWTAPGRGDDNTGTVINYDVRRATFEINEDNFYEADSIAFRHAQPSGFIEIMNSDELQPGTTYYYAVKSIDMFGNVSAISNMVSGKTKNAPVLDITDSFADTVSRYSTDLTASISIKNNGQEKLGYSATIRFNSYGYKNWAYIVNPNDTIEQGDVGTLNLIYSVSEMEDGVYTAQIEMHSNDPFREKIFISLSLLVYGHSATANLSTDNVDFGELYTGVLKTETFYLANSIDSRGFLQVSNTVVTNNKFKVLNAMPVFIAPGDSVAVNIQYETGEVETVNETLTLWTNNINQNKLNVNLSASSILPPEINVDNSKIEAVLNKPETYSANIKISNTGHDTLDVNFAVANINIVTSENVEQNIKLAPVLTEDFEETGIPAGWRIETKGMGWQFGDDLSSDAYFAGEYEFIIPEHTRYAAVNDDAYGTSNNAQFDYLITPEISLMFTDSAEIEFDSYYTGAYEMKAYVEISFDKGETWYVVKEINPSDNWERIKIDITPYVNKNITIAFHADDQGKHSSGWAIDNVSVNTNVNWVTITRVSGIDGILPDSSATYKVSFVTENLAQGEYSGNLTVLSNDPVNPQVDIPLSLVVYDEANVLLADLQVDGETVSNFSADRFIYEVDVESDNVPYVTATAQNPGATVTVQQAASITGDMTDRTAIVTVTSETGEYTKQYQVLFSKALGINAIEQNQINIYPNPFNTVVSVKLHTATSGQIVIRDIAGKVVMSDLFTNKENIKINTSSFDRGVYLITIQSNDNDIRTIKIIKE